MRTVEIVEVGARDGLQNEKALLTVSQKSHLVQMLHAAGLKRIEMGAFVSPEWVPQMADTEKVVKALKKQETLKKAFKHFSVLVPNVRGMEAAVAAGVKEVAVFGACSESFSQKNINCSIKESFRRFQEVLVLAKQNKIRVRGYLSTAFGCPYEGKVKAGKVVQLTQKFLDLGVFEVSIGDTIGVATPKQVQAVLKELTPHMDKIAMHMHNTRGTALANVLESLNQGVHVFDTSIGGLGGCPYAKGASGNLATEDLVYMLNGMGIKTQVELEELFKIRAWLEKQMQRTLPAHVRTNFSL